MSLMRSSSVWLVLSTLAYQPSLERLLDGLTGLAGEFIVDFLVGRVVRECSKNSKRPKKNRRESGGFLRFVAFFEVTQKSLYRRKRLRTRSNQNKTKLNAWQAM